MGIKIWKKLQKMSQRQIKRLQTEKFQRMLHYYAMTPYYSSMFDVQKIDIDYINSISDITKFPFTTKNDIVSTLDHPNKAEAFVVDPTKKLHRLPTLTTTKLLFSSRIKQELVREFKPVHIHFTAGRSAIEIPVLYTDYDLRQLICAADRMMKYLKLPSTVRVVNTFSYAPNLAFWQTFYATNSLGIFGLHTGGSKVMGTQNIIDTLERMQAEVLVGMPSYIMHLAQNAAIHDRNFSHLRYILLSGESVTSAFVHKLREILSDCRAKQVNIHSTYAFTEGKVTWAQCNEESGYHLYPDMEFIEIVNQDGNSVADGTSGEIVYTALDFRGTVFLRYKTGDFGSLETGPCPNCGATTPRLRPLITRSDEIRSLQLTKLKGTFIDFNSVKAFLSGLVQITEWQIILKKEAHGLDSVILYIATQKCKDISYIRKEIIREMRDRFNITPKIIEKKKEELVAVLGLDTELRVKRIIDER